ncbi:MAG: hypothetical protein H0U76_12260 [Ktedonobacteraceae bacterium]|nr:hypothetical protein [Ktedonobacteraceae bacterium]
MRLESGQTVQDIPDNGRAFSRLDSVSFEGPTAALTRAGREERAVGVG